MPPFPGKPARAAHDLSIHNQTAADAGAQNDAEHHFRPTPRAQRRLRQREAVSVIGNEKRQPEPRLQIGLQREPSMQGILATLMRPRIPDR